MQTYEWQDNAPVLIDRAARKRFSHVGWIMLMVIAVLYSVSMIIVWFLRRIHQEDNLLLASLFNYLPIYFTGFPLALFFFGMMDSVVIPKQKIPPARLFQIFLICLPVMYGGNLIGMALSALFSHGRSSSPVMEMLMEMTWLDYLAAVVVAPIIEEILCRKMIIDHTLRYGERTAIIFSALCFGLMHRNFYQFFYAFGLGLVFAYVYVRSGKLRYTIAYHMIINFLGGVVGPFLLRLIDYDRLMSLAGSGNIQAIEEFYAANGMGIVILLIYGMMMAGGAFAGVAFLIIRHKDIRFYRMPDQLRRGTVICTAYLNFGVLLFMAVCVIIMLLSLMS